MFPPNFAWGAATSAYQIEGGWQADEKGLSIWDTFCHEEGRVFGEQNGDVACSSYELWETDLACIQQLGLTHYRLSLAWARLLPDGTTRHVNQKGVQYYNKTFGDRVRLWITINEPYVCAKLGHEDGIHAPGLKEKGTLAYVVGHNMLRAHAMAWHSYDSGYRAEQRGAVSLALNSDWFEPLDGDCSEDAAAAERELSFTLGWFAWPVFVTGDYPEMMRYAIDAQSSRLGYTGASRLPKFSEGDPAVLGTADFFALNYYTSRKVKAGGGREQTLSMKCDRDAEDVLDPSWPVCGVSWLAVVPHGLRKLLQYIKDTFSNPAVYITENGFAQAGPLQIEDAQRCEFYKSTILEVAKAINEDGVNVCGYFAWSLMDNFEWADGFSVRFGLFHVDFSDSNLTRTIYRSGQDYARTISTYRPGK
ncbi:cytosolic beta-glucosidase isoform X2 [Oryzias latipes]|uniref:cytosolic beta-glucosidase isoform X2 n=1 Tax=Oryzias latipes TaxID=8090 RepID=UPI0005CBAB26|nr:cytosolic beta-glucosidase isoform X2 [Oryzias latipes]